MRTFYVVDSARPYPRPVRLEEDPGDGLHFEDLDAAWDRLEREAKAWLGLASRRLNDIEAERRKALEEAAKAAAFAAEVFSNRERSE